jgi:thioesterase domain-containing protein
MAGDYVDEIRSIQPHGPYLLGGFCFAGVVAFQTAKLLEDEGEEIELVLLIDSGAFGHRSKRNRRQKESAYLRDLLGRDRRAKWGWLDMRLAHVRQKVRDRLWFLIFDAWLRTGRPRPPWLQDMWLVNDRTIRRFVTPHANCRAALFVCGSSKGRVSSWAKLAGGGLEMIDIDLPGIDHEEMLFEPFVSTLATEVNSHLARLGATQAEVLLAQVTAPA